MTANEKEETSPLCTIFQTFFRSARPDTVFTGDSQGYRDRLFTEHCQPSPGMNMGICRRVKKNQKPIQTSANWLSTNQGLRKGSEPQKGRTSYPEVRIYPQHPQGLLSIPRLGGPSFVIKTSRKRCDVPNVTQWLYYVQIGSKARRHYQAASVRCASFRKLKDFKVNVWLSGRCWPIGSHPKHSLHLLDEQVRYHRGMRRVASKEEKRKKTPNMSDKNWSIRLPTALRRPLRQGKRYSMI